MSMSKLHLTILKWVRRWHRLYFELEVRVLVVMLEVYLCPPVYDGPNLTFIYTYIKSKKGGMDLKQQQFLNSLACCPK